MINTASELYYAVLLATFKVTFYNDVYGLLYAAVIKNSFAFAYKKPLISRVFNLHGTWCFLQTSDAAKEQLLIVRDLYIGVCQGIRWRLKLTEPYLVNQSGDTDDGRGAALVTLTTAEGPLPDRSEWFREPETPSSTLLSDSLKA